MNQLRTLCVMGTFDSQANQAVARIKEKLTAQGFGADTYEPHITFGIYTALDEAALCKWIEQIATRHKRIALCFNHFGFFADASICFLAPCPSGDLLRLHADIHKKYDNCCTDKGCLYSLEQKSWAPHTTLATVVPGQAEALLSIFREGFSPFTAELTQLKITSSETSENLAVFDLRD